MLAAAGGGLAEPGRAAQHLKHDGVADPRLDNERLGRQGGRQGLGLALDIAEDAAELLLGRLGLQQLDVAPAGDQDAGEEAADQEAVLAQLGQPGAVRDP